MPLLHLARTFLMGVTQAIYPNTCWVCHEFTSADVGPFCSSCLPHISSDPFPSCPRCSSTVGPHIVLKDGCPACRESSFAFDGVFRLAPYDGLLRDVILRMKHPGGDGLSEVIGGLAAAQFAPRLQPLQPDVVIPIPLHWTRRLLRGFNQADIIADCLARELGRPCRSRVLRRLRRTEHQTRQTSPSARRENVKGAFTVRSAARDLEGKTIILVDDVMTSGATLHEAARALNACRPKAVYAAVLAHSV